MGNKLALPVFCGNSNLCCCGKDAGNKRNRYRRRSSKNPANDTSRRESQLALVEEEEDVDLLDGRPRSSSAYSLPPISILHTSQEDYATDFSHLHPLNSQNADQNPSFLQTITSKLKPSALAHPLADDETTSFLLSSSCDPTSLDTAEPLQPDHLSHVARIADMRAQQELLLKSGIVEGLTDDQLLQEEEEARMKEEAEINERRKRAEELAKKLGINNSLKLTDPDANSSLGFQDLRNDSFLAVSTTTLQPVLPDTPTLPNSSRHLSVQPLTNFAFVDEAEDNSEIEEEDGRNDTIQIAKHIRTFNDNDIALNSSSAWATE